MRRRDILLGAAAAWSLDVIEAQATSAPRIGVLALGNNDPESFLRDFRVGLASLGLTDGRNIVVEVRSAGGKESLLAALAAELVQSKVDIIVAWQTPPAQAAKSATQEIPIVIWAGDPVGTGLVESIARPGGNVTGVSSAGAEIAGKRVAILREVLPSLRRIAALANASDPFARPFISQSELAAQTLGVNLQPIIVDPDKELKRAFEQMQGAHVDALLIQGSLLRQDVVDLALHYRLPSMGDYRQLPAIGGLISYAPNSPAMCKDMAVFVDKILKGRRPADLPVQLPTQFDLVINLKTANALGLTIPPTLLARADEVIE
jgi:putative tryptophan/tyrosine transport system substrate-binding protein